MNINEIASKIQRDERELEYYERRKLDLQGNKDTTREDLYNNEMTQLNEYIQRVNSSIAANRQVQNNYNQVMNDRNHLSQLEVARNSAQTEAERLQIETELTNVSSKITEEMKLLPAELVTEITNATTEQTNENNLDLLAEGFDVSKADPEAFKKVYRLLSKENQDNSDNLYKLNALNEEMKKRQKEEKIQENFLHDESGNIVMNPASNKPYPRQRKDTENDKEYEDFLKNYYTEVINFETQNKLITDQSVENRNTNTNTSMLAIEDKNKNNQSLPLIEDKQKNNQPVALIEDKSKNKELHPEVIPLIEDKQKNIPLIEDKQKNIPLIEEKPKKDEKEPIVKKGLISIIQELTKDLTIKKKSGKKYIASNIKVGKQFKKELQSGNYLYNIIHTASAVVKGIGMLIAKTAAKITLSKEQKQNMETLKDRISHMSNEEIGTIYKEYRGSRVIQERFPSAINVLLQQKMEEYALGNLSTLNQNIEKGYKNIFKTYMKVQAFDERLKDPKLTDLEKEQYEKTKNKYLTGKANLVKEIRSNYIEANKWMSGGLHGFSEDMKAATTKLSCVGKRFAKDHDLDQDLLIKEAKLEQIENKAIAEQNDEIALKAFIEMEQLLSGETEVKKSAFGNRSTGKKYYSPLAEQLDYRDDPFIKDVFTTVAVVGAGLSAFNAVKTHGVEADKMVSEQQAQADQANAANDATMNTVHQTGADIAGKRQQFTDGMTAQSNMDINNVGNTMERHALDESASTYGGWAVGSSEYHQADAAGHAFTTDLYNQTSSKIEDITSQYAAGSISQAQAMQSISDVSIQTQGALHNVIESYMPTFTEYAQSHPQFDLASINGAMQHIIEHPDAIINMNQGMIDVTNMGDNLAGLSVEHMNALTSLPSDLQTTLFGAASSAALAYRVASTTQASERKGKYGNEITKMVEESISKEGNVIKAPSK